MTPVEIQDLMKEVSKSVQDIGRKIGSPKNDPDDLQKLADALRYSAQTVEVVKSALLNYYEQSTAEAP